MARFLCGAFIAWNAAVSCVADPVVQGNGFSVASESVGFLTKDVSMPESSASSSDLQRARSKTHSGKVAGKSVEEIAQKINTHLRKHISKLRACSEFTHEELNQIVRTMFGSLSTELQQIYEGNKDNRMRRHQSLMEYEERWKPEAASLADPTSADALRDGKCAEILMLWAHHMPQQSKSALQAITFPDLPQFNSTVMRQQDATVASRYTSSFSCVTGHNQQSGSTSDHKFPHWPEEVHYYGMGHGAYPFWCGGESGDPAPIEVWWSEKQLAEKFYHSTCYMKECGYSKTSSGVPCYHLMLGPQSTATAYLYTANEDFCCISGPTSSGGGSGPGGNEKLAPPTSNFMDSMTQSGEMDFKGDFYTGKVKKYIMTLPQSEAVQNFWYLTTPDGKPVEQGEGGIPNSQDKPTNGGKGILIWHEYNTTSFESTTLDASVFKVPEVCQKTQTICQFP